MKAVVGVVRRGRTESRAAGRWRRNAEPTAGHPDLDALYFITLNSNRKSLTLNTKTPEGKAILEKLIRAADVLVENFAPGAMDRMGFTWERIQELNRG